MNLTKSISNISLITSIWKDIIILKLVSWKKFQIARFFKILKHVLNAKKDTIYKIMNAKQILKVSYLIVKDMKILTNVLNVNKVII